MQIITIILPQISKFVHKEDRLLLLDHRSLTHWLIKGHNLKGCVILRSQNCVSSRQESHAQIDNKGATVFLLACASCATEKSIRR